MVSLSALSHCKGRITITGAGYYRVDRLHPPYTLAVLTKISERYGIIPILTTSSNQVNAYISGGNQSRSKDYRFSSFNRFKVTGLKYITNQALFLACSFSVLSSSIERSSTSSSFALSLFLSQSSFLLPFTSSALRNFLYWHQVSFQGLLALGSNVCLISLIYLVICSDFRRWRHSPQRRYIV